MRMAVRPCIACDIDAPLGGGAMESLPGSRSLGEIQLTKNIVHLDFVSNSSKLLFAITT
jgi:hypothetical protein